MSWGRLAELYLRAKAAARKGDVTLLQQFYQKRLGAAVARIRRGLQAGDRPGRLPARARTGRRRPGWMPAGRIVPAPSIRTKAAHPAASSSPWTARWTTCSLVVRAWAADGSSRLVWNERVLTFTDVEAVQERFGIHPNLVFVDAGYATYDVYRECAKRGWIALIGDKRADRSPTRCRGGKSDPAVLLAAPQGGARPRAVLLRPLLEQPQHQGHARPPAPQPGPGQRARPGRCPTTSTTTTSPRWKASTGSRRTGKWMWEQIGSRPNHYFDCEAMQVAAATMLKIVGREAAKPEPVDTPDGGVKTILVLAALSAILSSCAELQGISGRIITKEGDCRQARRPHRDRGRCRSGK